MTHTPEEFIEEKVKDLYWMNDMEEKEFRTARKVIREAIEFGKDLNRNAFTNEWIEEAKKEGASEERKVILEALPKGYDYPDMGQLGETVKGACNHVLNDIRSIIKQRNI